MKLQNQDFNKLNQKDQQEIFSNLTEAGLTSIIDSIVTAVKNNNYDGNVEKV